MCCILNSLSSAQSSYSHVTLFPPLVHVENAKISVYVDTVLTESKLTPRKGQISISLQMQVYYKGRNTLVKKNFDRMYRSKVICISQGVKLNLLSVSTVLHIYSTFFFLRVHGHNSTLVWQNDICEGSSLFRSKLYGKSTRSLIYSWHEHD